MISSSGSGRRENAFRFFRWSSEQWNAQRAQSVQKMAEAKDRRDQRAAAMIAKLRRDKLPNRGNLF
jgi:hypothetical protein